MTSEVKMFLINLQHEVLMSESENDRLDIVDSIATFLEEHGGGFPCLTRLVETMGLDNSLVMLAEPDWPSNAMELEMLARKLDHNSVANPEEYGETYADEYELMAEGEASDIEHLVVKRQLQPLQEFLTEVFDGDLHERFYK